MTANPLIGSDLQGGILPGSLLQETIPWNPFMKEQNVAIGGFFADMNVPGQLRSSPEMVSDVAFASRGAETGSGLFWRRTKVLQGEH